MSQKEVNGELLARLEMSGIKSFFGLGKKKSEEQVPIPPSDLDMDVPVPPPMVEQALPEDQKAEPKSESEQPAPQEPEQQPEAQKKDEYFDLPDFDEKEIREVEKPAQPIEISPPEPVKISPIKKALEETWEPPESHKQVSEPEKLIDIKKCFQVKEDLTMLRLQVKKTEDAVEQHTTITENHKFTELTETLAFIQEKLIEIDNSLF